MSPTTSEPVLKAVIFDIGGVVLSSPFIAIAQYEQEIGIPTDYLNVSITKRGSGGAWQRFERGELSLFHFYKDFGNDLSDTAKGNAWYKEYCLRKGIGISNSFLGGQSDVDKVNLAVPSHLPEKVQVDGRELFGRMMKQAQVYDPYILTAIERLREAKTYRVIALTNNFSGLPGGEPIPQSELEYLGWQDGVVPDKLRALFDDFCDSSAVGMSTLRKPEVEFYLEACKRNSISPNEAIFLDDIRMNLKPARELGMQTIHVPIGGTLRAVQELGSKIGIDLIKGTDVVAAARL